jgi:hypothetical protein
LKYRRRGVAAVERRWQALEADLPDSLNILISWSIDNNQAREEYLQGPFSEEERKIGANIFLPLFEMCRGDGLFRRKDGEPRARAQSPEPRAATRQ